MKGYFAIGVEGISKAMNLGAVMRTANAFGASFVFTVAAHHRTRDIFRSDTARTARNLPWYSWESVDEMVLPKGCALVGIELVDEAIELPSFRHPRAAAYVLGRERGDLSEAMLERCEHVVKIPTKFCVNLAVAAAITMYDRAVCLGGYPERPIMPGGPEIGEPHVWGAPKSRTGG
jgi:tRNA G18 (ribose-2'-O)-methylase SpoU